MSKIIFYCAAIDNCQPLWRIPFTFKVFLRFDKSREGLFLLLSMTPMGENIFFCNSKISAEIFYPYNPQCSKPLLCHATGMLKVVRNVQVCLFQDTVETIWNPKCYYILIEYRNFRISRSNPGRSCGRVIRRKLLVCDANSVSLSVCISQIKWFQTLWLCIYIHISIIWIVFWTTFPWRV